MWAQISGVNTNSGVANSSTCGRRMGTAWWCETNQTEAHLSGSTWAKGVLIQQKLPSVVLRLFSHFGFKAGIQITVLKIQFSVWWSRLEGRNCDGGRVNFYIIILLFGHWKPDKLIVPECNARLEQLVLPSADWTLLLRVIWVKTVGRLLCFSRGTVISFYYQSVVVHWRSEEGKQVSIDFLFAVFPPSAVCPCENLWEFEFPLRLRNKVNIVQLKLNEQLKQGVRTLELTEIQKIQKLIKRKQRYWTTSVSLNRIKNYFQIFFVFIRN